MKRLFVVSALLLWAATAATAAMAQAPTGTTRANGLTPATVPLSQNAVVSVDVGDPTNYGEQISALNVGLVDLTYTYNVPTTGFSITIGAGVRKLVLNPAGTLATGTIIFPASAVDRWPIEIVAINNPVTAVTFTPTGGTTIFGAPAGLTANVPVRWQYTASCSCYAPD